MAAKKTSKKVDTSKVKLSETPGKPDTLTPATDTAASGALVEPTITERIDTDHPAVDNEPRKGQPVAANLIDFNDPAMSDAEAVVQNLKSQSKD